MAAAAGGQRRQRPASSSRIGSMCGGVGGVVHRRRVLARAAVLGARAQLRAAPGSPASPDDDRVGAVDRRDVRPPPAGRAALAPRSTAPRPTTMPPGRRVAGDQPAPRATTRAAVGQRQHAGDVGGGDLTLRVPDEDGRGRHPASRAQRGQRDLDREQRGLDDVGPVQVGALGAGRARTSSSGPVHERGEAARRPRRARRRTPGTASSSSRPMPAHCDALPGEHEDAHGRAPPAGRTTGRGARPAAGHRARPARPVRSARRPGPPRGARSRSGRVRQRPRDVRGQLEVVGSATVIGRSRAACARSAGRTAAGQHPRQALPAARRPAAAGSPARRAPRRARRGSWCRPCRTS